MKPNTYTSWLSESVRKLEQANIPTAYLDSLVLLENATSKNRSYILAYPKSIIGETTLNLLNNWLRRRLKHEPTAYIIGHKEFYKRQFKVDKRVLIPRPESELIIDSLKQLKPKAGQNLIDIGTGSGCLAITAKIEIPHIIVDACDISQPALEVARLNAKLLGADINFFQKDLTDICDTYDYILANLPYVPDRYEVDYAARYEPEIALFAGHEGLDLINRFAAKAFSNLKANSYLILESLPFQQEAIIKKYQSNGFLLFFKQDLILVFQNRL